MAEHRGVPVREFDLRRVKISAFEVEPVHETGLRNRTVYAFEQGTGTTHETRTLAQADPPSRLRVQWASHSGDTGSYEAPNPAPRSTRSTWAAWGAGIGAGVGGFVGMHVGRNLGSAAGGWGSQLGESLGGYVGAGVGAVAGAGLGALAGYFAAPTPRYDAGHKLPKQMGGAGHLMENIVGQNPQINRGNYLEGRPTFDIWRRGENEMAAALKHSGGGQVTHKAYR